MTDGTLHSVTYLLRPIYFILITSFNASKPLEMDFGELSFNAFVKDINEIGLRLVVEKVRET